METRRVLMRSLAVVVVIASVIWTTTAAGAEKMEVNKFCCTKVSSSVLTDPIIGIRLQREDLPCVKAVVFETKRGDFCSDPKQGWVKKKVEQFLKVKLNNRAQRNKPLTSTPPPTSSTSDQTHLGGSTQATDSSSV